MKNRTVKNTLIADMIDMGGLPVRQALPTHNVDQISPFLLLHHGGIPAPAGSKPLQAGVPPHPHRGFAPVTIVLEGEVHHRDSLGNSSVVGAGGVQWIHAGRGIIHSERPSATLAENGGMMSVIQLWINLPAANKMDAPWYKALPANKLTKVEFSDGVEMHLIAGEFGQFTGPVTPSSPLLLASLYMKAGTTAELPVNAEFNAALYLTSGSGSLSGHGLAEKYQLLQLNNDGESFAFTANEDTHIVLLAGEPINEPVAHYGPFVMNNQTQIMEALRDYSAHKMGILIEEL
jgi:redox-sensitive bicupin YhaK (pirin superfamily)